MQRKICAPPDQNEASHAAEPMPERNDLLQQYENSKADDPIEVHHTAEEQERHQEPATPETICAVLQSHEQSAQSARPPVADQKSEWRAAMAQAHGLQRRELP